MTSKKDKTHDREIRKEAFKKLGFIFVGLLLLVNTIQLARFGEIVERVDSYNKGVIDELGGFREDVMTFGNDMNEIRQFLLLPTKEYSFMEQTAEITDTQEKAASRTESALYAFLGKIAEEETYEQNAAAAVEKTTALIKDADFIEELKKAELKMGKLEQSQDAATIKILAAAAIKGAGAGAGAGVATGDARGAVAAGEPLFAVVVDKKTTKVSVQSVLGTHEAAAAEYDGLKKELLDYFTKNKEQVAQLKAVISEQKNAIAALPKNKDMAAVFAEKKLRLGSPAESEDSIDYFIVNNENENLLGISIQRKDGAIQMEGAAEAYGTADELLPPLLEKLKTLDASTEQEKMIKARRAELEAVFSEAEFQDLLSSSGLSLVTAPREEFNKLLYDVKNAEGKVVFSFAIELSSGYLKILKDNEEIDLYSTLDGSKKKTLTLPENIPDYGDEAKSIAGQLNILVAGKHGSLVDTMIFANINPEKRRVTLVSVPRDLQYNGRKINSIYHYYGMEELKRALSFVTGYKIDKYILIDMYAFIDVIDMIGGVDVHLDAPVIDPTYKTYDGGKWGTLYYRAGDHHLSGKQALRLARTRHTSSDFARAERQQMILEALQKKAQNLGFGDAAGLTKLAESVIAKTETDITLAQAISYYFRYQKFDISRGHVISSGNVLFSQYTGDAKRAEQHCNAIKEGDTQQRETCDKIDRGAYILLPRNEDWNSVRWYFHQIIEGAEK